MAGYLERVVARKRLEVAERGKLVPRSRLEYRAARAPLPRDFRGALRSAPGPAVIAEIKRRSPSAGTLAVRSFDPAGIAADYARAGARALSVLTDGPDFGGSLEDLAEVRRAVDLPLLRKDFLVDPYQVLEARAAGADAVLLIVGAVAPPENERMLREAHALGMEALVEVFHEGDLDAVPAETRLLGVNHRDLRSERLDMDPDRTAALSGRVGRDRLLVAESGLSTPADLARLLALPRPPDAFLIGAALLKQGRPGEALAGLLGGSFARR